MGKPTRTAEELKPFVLARVDAIKDLRGQINDAHRGG
ncbi:hypothetical protein J2W27_004652 [Variovorax boronicumulans]|nr:hypothetical protein [Variovorax boronicumulans]